MIQLGRYLWCFTPEKVQSERKSFVTECDYFLFLSWQVALSDLKTNPKIYSLLAYFVNFIASGVSQWTNHVISNLYLFCLAKMEAKKINLTEFLLINHFIGLYKF